MHKSVPPGNQQFRAQIPLRIALIYALAAGIWIPVSNWALSMLAPNPALLPMLQTVKAGFSVLVMALLLYWFVRRNMQAVMQVEGNYQSNLHFLETLLDTIPNPVFYKDARGVYQGCNTAFATRILGLPKERIVGASIFDLTEAIPADLAHIYHQQDMALLQNPGTQIYEAQVRTANGTRRDFIFNKAAFFDRDGQTAGMVGVMVDISERKRAEDALREREVQYRMLVDHSPIPIMVHSEGKIVFVNQATIDVMHGTGPEDFLGKSPVEFVHPEFRTVAQDRMREVYNKTGVAPALAEKFLAVDGSIIDVEVMGTPIDFYGKPAVQTVFQDVTARLQSESLRRLLSTAIEQTSDNVLITDANATILYVNPAFEQTTGYTLKEAVGKTPRLLNSGRQDAAFYRTIWNTLQAGHVWQGRLVNRKKDNSLYTNDITISPVLDETNNIVNFVSVQRDVSHELQLEEQYYQSQKMESVGRLAGGVAHDFNNLLTGIMGFSELAMQSLPPGNPARSDIQSVLKNATRAANLTRQLLAFARRQTIDPKILNLNEVILNLNKMVRRLIGEDIVLETNLAEDLGQVKADPGQIEQVLLNLAVNARDALPDGGRLLIETANVTLTDKTIDPSTDLEPGTYVTVAVSDNGLGMTDDVKARIFEPFFTTKEVGRGTGLGLATVFGVIKQAQGHILVSSKTAEGTIFKIYLPRVFAPPEITPVEPLQPQMLPHGTETILLVEDEESVRELSAYALRDQGYTVLIAADGTQAIPLARQHTGPIDLLLTDVVMPYMGGKTLAKKLKQVYPMLKILFTSGYTDSVSFYPEMHNLETAFLPKPFLPATLVQKVRTLLDSDPDQ